MSRCPVASVMCHNPCQTPMSLPITFVRGANLECLTIEALVDLANPKLIVRFQDVSTASAATGRATNAGAQPNAASTSWLEADAQWASKGDLDW